MVPGFRAHYLRPVGTDGFERFELLAGFDNPFSHLALPPRINVNMGKPAAPPLVVYRTEAVDLFLTPLGYQLFRTADGTYWPAVSTRAYPQEAMEFPHFTVNKTVVLVQDVFEGTNFSHFLFDWLPRLGHFLNSGLADPSQCVFVMGGAPSEFHFHALRAMCDMFSLDEAQFVFPLASEIWHIEGSLYYFSDLKAAIMHPAHMAHRRSMAIVRDVAARVQSPVGDLKRIYISRGDTPLRKIANEIELSRALRSLGFMEVQLGAIPYLEQLKLVRGAEVIVAPHGMGLTHIAFHDGRPLIIEIHNPNIGTDAYAFISHALGFTYRPVFGTALAGDGNHFTVDPRDVIAILAEEGISAPPEAARDGTSPGVRAVFFPGVQSISPSEMLGADPLGPAIAEYRHVRDDPAVQSDNNVGWLETSGLSVGAIYHCSCDVWLPSGFEGERLVLEGSSDKILGVSHADLSQREQWQTIRVHVVANRDVVAFVLRCDCGAADFFYSRKWTFDAGTAANGAG